MKVKSQVYGRRSGMALVITLIMLSIITFMAVTFLIISQRERGAVSTTTDATTARFAVDAALERAEAQILAPIMALTNDQAYDIVVSTNYINGEGFNTVFRVGPTNVNFDFTSDIGHPQLAIADLIQNIANLQFDPRVPVYMQTNPAFPGKEMRFYLDLNRNGRFETNGWLPVLSGRTTFPTFDVFGNPVDQAGYAPPNVLSNFFVGDPEWIGLLEHPDQPHSASNRFTARIAYIAVPVSRTLDINYIHNYAKRLGYPAAPVAGRDGFLRNQGIGSWDINLGAFLTDLNTNQWNPPANPYIYDTNVLNNNHGNGFDDALSILTYRYTTNYKELLPTLGNMYANNVRLVNDGINQYSDGPLQLTTAPIVDNELPAGASFNVPWSGGNNTNHYFTAQELFDPAKTSVAFTNRLTLPGTNNSSYDRYTYYRMLSQLGTDSAAESGKINVNYVNVDAAGNIIPQLSTNFIRWGALQFFTNAANRILHVYTREWFQQDPSNYLATFYNIHTNYYYPIHYDTSGNDDFWLTNSPTGLGLTNIPYVGITNEIPTFGLTNIPVYANRKPVYSPAVHRLLQIVANIYDAQTNRIQTGYPYLPSVFRPIFYVDLNTNVSIQNFVEVLTTNALFADYNTFPDLGSPLVLTNADRTYANNIYGMPWVIGVKKGYPGFNQLSFKTDILVTRKLRLSKLVQKGAVTKTEQMYVLGITNTVGISAWNPYGANFPRQLEVWVTNDYSFMVTTNSSGGNGIPLPVGTKSFFGMGTTNGIPLLINSWSAASLTFPKRAFVNLIETDGLLSNAMYQVTPSPVRFIPSTNSIFSIISSGTADQPMPQWYLISSNRFRFALIDKSLLTPRVVDYVNLDMASNILDITGAVIAGAQCPPDFPQFWCTNPVSLTYPPNINTRGVEYQIEVSLGTPHLGDAFWNAIIADPANQAAISSFQQFVVPGGSNTNLFAQTPFNPTYVTNSIVSWQANDPLVHYTLDDLRTLPSPDKFIMPPTGPNSRYQPWGGKPLNPNAGAAYDTTIKDPAITSSDAWLFPTNVYPNIGWIGRVHRGSPWQTVYLKGSDPALIRWELWSGHQDTNTAKLTMPSQDRLLFDVFTTAINDNATHGQLSVNQSGLAAWSAVLSGVMVLTNDNSGNLTPTNFQPAALSPEVLQMVGAINHARGNTDPAAGPVFQDRLFAHVGDVLAATNLALSITTNGVIEKAPFLNTSALQSLTAAGLSDDIVERIPQQIMSLLTLDHEPRFVIYAYGQTLRPADRSIVMNGPFFGLCTNYQVTAESATRTVIRIENAPRPNEPYKVPRVVVEGINVMGPD